MYKAWAPVVKIGQPERYYVDGQSCGRFFATLWDVPWSDQECKSLPFAARRSRAMTRLRRGVKGKLWHSRELLVSNLTGIISEPLLLFQSEKHSQGFSMNRREFRPCIQGFPEPFRFGVSAESRPERLKNTFQVNQQSWFTHGLDYAHPMYPDGNKRI